ncbi:MAG: polyprenyl synthetase family protein [Chloroflexota bacterium]|nr:polyprenyl synthetase family protein [Chloroflexota bacterium]
MNTSFKLSELSALYRNNIQAELKDVIDGCPLHLRSILRYHMGCQGEENLPGQRKSGKLIRSTLCLLSCQAVGGNPAQIFPAAATLELIHNFSLIHDDIQDASYERHGRPTVWRLWGQSQAINAGDIMFALAILALLRLKQNGITDEEIMYSFRLLSKTCLEICEGQYLDIAYENQFDITIDDYLDMIRRKTAVLMAASTSLGAYLAKGGEKAACFYQFGEELGMAYQICDDILGIWGTSGSTGKPVNGDIQQRKKTLPVIYGFKNSSDQDKAKLEKLYSQKEIQEEDVSTVAMILVHAGARDYAQNLAKQYYRQALKCLEATNLDKACLTPLREMAYLLVERNY